jgi:MFS superfamily sulfate permease-like transporter
VHPSHILVFRSYDLLYEWLFEIREKFFLSEYCIVWATFLAIQVVGMDAGIVIGVLVAIVGHVIHSANTTGVYRLNKKSRAVWTPEQYKLLQDHGYNLQAPKIITLGTFRSLSISISITLRLFISQCPTVQKLLVIYSLAHPFVCCNELSMNSVLTL